MGRAQDRVAARRAVHEAQLERRREQVARDKQLKALAVEVQLDLLEGRNALHTREVAAGASLERMVEDFSASAREIVEWCCGAVTLREVARLRGLARDAAAGFDHR